jgi:cytidylate kinase
MRTRDRRDSEREASPLKPAPGAVILDTTSLSLEEVVTRIVELVCEVREKYGKSPTVGDSRRTSEE